MKKIIIIILLLNNLCLIAQEIEIIGGLSRNNFYNMENDLRDFQSSYTPGLGYVVRIGIDDIELGWQNIRLMLSYENYNGKVWAKYEGKAGDFITNSEISKSVVSFSFFPVNLQIFKKWNINLGLEISGLVNNTVKGTNSGWTMGHGLWSHDLSERKYNSNLYFGLRGRIAYEFFISKKYAIVPQYSYYLGLTNEFTEFPEGTNSMKQYFCIGIKRKIGTN